MAYYCHKCRNEIDFIIKVGIKVGRNDHCIHCGADMHVCKNCRHYDPGLHNQCRIPEADFIRERTVANFCAQFDFLERDTPPERDDSADKARAKLNSLFKNLR